MYEVTDPYDCFSCPLQDCPGLRPLEDDERAYLNRFKKGEVRYDRGDTIIEEGRETRRLYTVLEGVLIRYLSLEDGRRQIVNFMFPGDLVGLQGAFDEPASHSVEALIDARLCVFPRGDFVSLLKNQSELGYDITWLAAKEETELEGHILSLGQRSAKERVVFLAAWLIDRALATGLADKGNRLEIPVTQSQIADMLGLSLVHTNRTIRALDRDGMVNWSSRELRVPDMDKAAEYADFDRSRRSSRPFI